MRPYRFQPYRRAAVLPLHSDRRVTCLENLPSFSRGQAVSSTISSRRRHPDDPKHSS